MATHSVQLRLVPSFSVECKFWLQDDGWNGTAEEFSITIRASTLEQAKDQLESAMGKFIVELVRERKALKSHAA